MQPEPVLVAYLFLVKCHEKPINKKEINAIN